MKMTVLYFKDTGQVMAAVTRAALAEATPETTDDGASAEVKALVGDALLVRSYPDLATTVPTPTLFSIPADQLTTLTVDREEVKLLSPRGCAVLNDELVSVPSPPQATVPNRSTIQVDLPPEVPADLPNALYLVPETGPADGNQYLQGVFKPPTATARVLTFNLPDALAPGDYGVLVLIKGYRCDIRRLAVT